MRLGVVAEQRLLFYMAEALRLSLRGRTGFCWSQSMCIRTWRCFDTNWKCVERGLRRAANVAWNTAPEKLSELAHRHLTEKPSVSELLSLLTIYLRAEGELKPVAGHQAPALPGLSAYPYFFTDKKPPSGGFFSHNKQGSRATDDIYRPGAPLLSRGPVPRAPPYLFHGSTLKSGFQEKSAIS